MVFLLALALIVIVGQYLRSLHREDEYRERLDEAREREFSLMIRIDALTQGHREVSGTHGESSDPPYPSPYEIGSRVQVCCYVTYSPYKRTDEQRVIRIEDARYAPGGDNKGSTPSQWYYWGDVEGETAQFKEGDIERLV